MANNIYNPGPIQIFSTTSISSAQSGSWFRLHPKVRNVTIQASQVGSSVGVTVGSTIFVEVSNDGVNPIATKAATIAFNGASPQSDGVSLDAHWEYLRITLNQSTTGTVTGLVSGNFQTGP